MWKAIARKMGIQAIQILRLEMSLAKVVGLEAWRRN